MLNPFLSTLLMRASRGLATGSLALLALLAGAGALAAPPKPSCPPSPRRCRPTASPPRPGIAG
ncbi:hypothetical protein ACFJIX_05975 [Roseateles sp. UC29_93]|uniref:hypothetical protein n=1 Tax=Roseateles sp. UC29_93 TaxID=3350177 RepID=UPI00366D0DB3